MPVIRHLPAIKVIKGFRGILDFYCWKSLYCVRKWPRIPYANRTAASLASAALFGAISAGYALLGSAVKDLLAEDAADHNRTGRDLYISAVLGHLHEASMSDFLELLTQATAHLAVLKDLANALNAIGTDELRVKPAYDGADYFPLLIDAQRHLQADILASALPTGAATAAHQATQTTALNLIKKLEAALESVHTDRLKVRGENQLITYAGPLNTTRAATISGPGGYTDSDTPPAGHTYCLYNIALRDQTSPITGFAIMTRTNGISAVFTEDLTGMAALKWATRARTIFLSPTDTIRVYYTGALAGDTCEISILGHDMTLET